MGEVTFGLFDLTLAQAQHVVTYLRSKEPPCPWVDVQRDPAGVSEALERYK